MPQYNYIAVDEKSGKEVKGSIEAATEAMAAAELRKEGLFATKIKEGTVKKKKGGSLNINLDFQFGPSIIKSKQLMVITRQLATLLEAGLPLIRSLRTLQRQCKDKMAQKECKFGEFDAAIHNDDDGKNVYFDEITGEVKMFVTIERDPVTGRLSIRRVDYLE